jgi:hypothetical protein
MQILTNVSKIIRVCVVCVCIGLAACTTHYGEFSEIAGPAKLDRKIQPLAVFPAQKEQVRSVVLMFLEPVVAGQSTELINAYKTSGSLGNAGMISFADRAVEFFKLNGLNAAYVIKVNPGADANQIANSWTARGFHPLVFEAIGGKLVTRNGVPYSGKTNYKVTLYSLALKPLMEFQDEFSTRMYTINYNDTILAGWMNILADQSHIDKPQTVLKQPPW